MADKNNKGLMKIVIGVGILLVITSIGGKDKKQGFGCSSGGGGSLICNLINNEPLLYETYVSGLESWTSTTCSETTPTTYPGCLLNLNYFNSAIHINGIDTNGTWIVDYILIKCPVMISPSTLPIVDTCSQFIVNAYTEEGTEPTSFAKNGRTIYNTPGQPGNYVWCNKYDNVIIGGNLIFLNRYFDEYFTEQCN